MQGVNIEKAVWLLLTMFNSSVEGLSQVKRRDREKEELCSKHNIEILYYTNVNINKMPCKLIRNIDALIQEIKK